MGGAYPAGIDLFVFAAQPCFSVAFGPTINARAQVEGLRKQLTPQAEYHRTFELQPSMSDLDDTLAGFLQGRQLTLCQHNHTLGGTQDEGVLFPHASRTIFTLRPVILTVQGGDDISSAVLYSPEQLLSIVPALAQATKECDPDNPNADVCEAVTEWARVCSQTTRHIITLLVP